MDYNSPLASKNDQSKNSGAKHYEEPIDDSQKYDPTSPITPPEIKRWNWGAFMFSWIWGIGNYTYLPLLSLVPILNIVWIFVCGAKGNEWAWKSGQFKSVKEFLTVQNTWNRAGILIFIISCVFLVFYFIIIYLLIIMFFSFLGSFSGSL